MPETCCAVNCSSRRCKSTTTSTSFYRIPADEARRNRWIAALRREKSWSPTKYTRLCSVHFISGSKSDDPLSPDYVPSLFDYTSPTDKEKHTKRLGVFGRRHVARRKRLDNVRRSSAALGLLSLGQEENSMYDGATQVECTENCPTPVMTAPTTCSIATQTELTLFDINAVFDECQSLRSESLNLREQQNAAKYDMPFLEGNDEKVRQFTGFSSYAVLLQVFLLVQGSLKDKCLTASQQFILTMMRLRLSVSPLILGLMYGVHRTTVSRVVLDIIEVLHSRLVPMVLFWPKRHEVQQTIPMCFRQLYSKCIAIIDCFELFIERPSDLKARAQTYSNYKSHNTMKYLIGITPQGHISYISKGWGGRVSDKHLTENCDFLDHLKAGDLVLADRGFNIHESIALCGATLYIPAFTRGKTQLDPEDVQKTRSIANVRIHVERVIGLLRQRYTLLDGTLPIQLLQGNGGEFTTLDKMVRVCCALCNISNPIVPSH